MNPGLAAFWKARRFWAVPLLLVAVAAVPAGGEPPGPDQFPDVPRQASACVVLRFGDFYRSPAGQAVLKNLTEASPKVAAELEKAYGFPLSQVEVVTAVVTSVSKDGPDTAAIIVDFNKPVKPADVLKALSQGDQNRDGLPAGVYRLRGSGTATIGLAGDRRFTIFTNERARTEYPELLLRRGPGAMDEALALAAQRPVLALGFRTADIPRPGQDDFAPQARAILPLVETQAVTVRAVLDKALRVDVRLDYGDKSDAAKAEKALGALRTLLLFELNGQLQRFKQKGDRIGEQSLEAVQAAFKGASFERDGARVVIKGELAPEWALADLARNVAGELAPTGDSFLQNNLRQIALALHNYESAHGTFPAAAVCDKNGKPLLSWRVMILPYIEQDALYRQFRLNEPWDSDHNKKLLDKVPQVYHVVPQEPGAPAAAPRDGVPERSRTPIRVFVGGGAAFDLRKGANIVDFADGTSNTILVGVAAETVPWTKPDELTYDPKRPLPALATAPERGPLVAFADGSVRRLPANLKPDTLRALITRGGGEVVSLDE